MIAFLCEKKTTNHHTHIPHAPSNKKKHTLDKVQVREAGGTTALATGTQQPGRGGGRRGRLGFLGRGLHSLRGSSGGNDGLNIVMSL